ncbi:cell division protein FtsB [Vibrio cincinnatiensis]|jgi:cell division protein FtsB|uniref:Cell division protein FtsB n=2 Tax=Vibrio cincinnatiensis TaxID=675 RepID=A0A1T4S4N9_VIBCI|nr:cell division protein FtsB [Vibrio cincinnatiensis DSM 19608]SUP49371.1 cell division protein FtsB [Vibrio cincinnatiensis]
MVQSWPVSVDVMRVFAITLLLLFGWLQYHLWLGKNGIADYRLVASEIVVQEQVNSNLQQRNQEMFAEIDDLRQGLDAIEERARHELGMVKEGETFFRVIGEESR